MTDGWLDVTTADTGEVIGQIREEWAEVLRPVLAHRGLRIEGAMLQHGIERIGGRRRTWWLRACRALYRTVSWLLASPEGWVTLWGIALMGGTLLAIRWIDAHVATSAAVMVGIR